MNKLSHTSKIYTYIKKYIVVQRLGEGCFICFGIFFKMYCCRGVKGIGGSNLFLIIMLGGLGGLEGLDGIQVG